MTTELFNSGKPKSVGDNLQMIFAVNSPQHEACLESSVWAKPISGCYEGKTEKSFLTSEIKWGLSWADEFNQESVLILDIGKSGLAYGTNPSAWLFFLKTGEWKNIGHWREISEAEHLNVESFSLIDGKYYVAM